MPDPRRSSARRGNARSRAPATAGGPSPVAYTTSNRRPRIATQPIASALRTGQGQRRGSAQEAGVVRPRRLVCGCKHLDRVATREELEPHVGRVGCRTTDVGRKDSGDEQHSHRSAPGEFGPRPDTERVILADGGRAPCRSAHRTNLARGAPRKPNGRRVSPVLGQVSGCRTRSTPGVGFEESAPDGREPSTQHPPEARLVKKIAG